MMRNKLISMSALIVAVTCLPCPILAGAVSLELNPDGVSDIQEAYGGFFAIGGALLSIDSIHGEEYLFGSTGSPGFFPNYLHVEVDGVDVAVPTTNQGWVNLAHPQSEPGITNYFVGQHVGLEYRDYFVFDFSSLNGTVTSAWLVLYEHPDVDSYGNSISRSGNSIETLGLFSVETDPTMLGPTVDPVVWADLGSGTSYGEFTFTIIPEPATLLLLGLGVLIVRKKR